MGRPMNAVRGKHGCYVHVEMWGQSTASLTHARKSSHHSAPVREPNREGPTSALILNATCSRCGATVVRTPVGNGYREDWTIHGMKA